MRSVNRSIMSDTRLRKGSPVINGNITKFESLAEGMVHFQKNTPERFHKKQRSDPLLANRNHFKRPSIAKAITPNLISHFPNSPVATLEAPTREVKLPTKARPFNLTQVTKKVQSTQKVPFKFTAKFFRLYNGPFLLSEQEGTHTYIVDVYKRQVLDCE